MQYSRLRDWRNQNLIEKFLQIYLLSESFISYHRGKSRSLQTNIGTYHLSYKWNFIFHTYEQTKFSKHNGLETHEEDITLDVTRP